MSGREYKSAGKNELYQRALRIIKGTATYADRFFPDHVMLVAFLDILRGMGCIICFITGVWDLIHIGHATYIWRGKEETRKLYPDAEHIITVIGVDSDAFTKRRKGPERPIVPEDERLRMLAHLRSVDILTLQTEADQLFRIVPHEVRVLSESTKDLPGLAMIQEQCEHVVNLPPQAETSTTARIRRLSFDGANALLLNVEKRLAAMLSEVRDGIR